jgi:serine/threonine protein kinase
VKVKLVSVEKKGLLQHELKVLRLLVNSDSKFFVKPLHDALIPSHEFTLSASANAKDLRFDDHVAMVLEAGEITLSDYLRVRGKTLSHGKLLDIIYSLVCMVLDAHDLDFVLMDIKDQNVMLFKDRWDNSWKGIDLDGSLKNDTLLNESSFMATIRFMAPELLTGAATRARFSQDIWSLGMLIFLIFCKENKTFWSLLGIYHDADIKAEVVSGRLTQKRIDELIDRTFPGHDHSSLRHFLKRMLVINPLERWTIQSLRDAALLKGTASISGSVLYEGQKKIMSEMKSLQELLKTELRTIQTGLQSLLDEDHDDNDLGHINTALNELQALLFTQAQSTADCKAAIQSLISWESSAASTSRVAAIPPVLSDFMGTVTSQLRDLLSKADHHNADSAETKDLMLRLSNEVKVTQQQVQHVGDAIARLHADFVEFGVHVRRELRSNASNHTELLTKMQAIDDTVQELTKEQDASRETILKEIQTFEQVKQMFASIKQDTTEMDKKIDANQRLLRTLVDETHSIPTLMVLLPVLKKGIKKYDPRNLYRDQGRLVFICAETMQLVECGKNGKGYEVNTVLPWVKEALPVLKVGLMLLQVGLLASGLPIPLAGLADAVLGQSDKHSFLKSAVGLLQDNISADSLGSDLDSALAEKEVAAAVRGLQAGEHKGDIRHAYKALYAFLKDQDPTLLHLGMVKVISHSGRVGWVISNSDEFHISNIGRLIEANESEIRQEMDAIYINKTR